jgi:hypothetical protein
MSQPNSAAQRSHRWPAQIDGDSAAILSVIHDPDKLVELEAVAAIEPPLRVARVIPRDDTAIAVAELDQVAKLHAARLPLTGSSTWRPVGCVDSARAPELADLPAGPSFGVPHAPRHQPAPDRGAGWEYGSMREPMTP